MPASTAASSDVGLGIYDDMDALLSPAEPRSDAAMIAIRAEAALAADRKLEADIKASAAAKAAASAKPATAFIRNGAIVVADVGHVKEVSGASLANMVDLDSEQLRGVSVPTLLAGNARLFANGGAAARKDPAGTFALSRPVRYLDYFISHSWRTPRLAKWLALLLYFNLSAAYWAWASVLWVCFWFLCMYFEGVPAMFQGAVSNGPWDASLTHNPMLCQFFSALALGVVLLTYHRFARRNETAFLDIACIDQLDAGKKAAGIASLGALLDRSDRMVVLFDEHYMTRMWCVFELAAFAKRGSLDRMDIVPLHIALIKGACLTVLVLMNFPMLYVNNSMESYSLPVFMCISIFFFGPCFLFVMIADNRGRAARQAIEKLRDFKLSDASCASTADRDAIIALIGRWWADDHWRADEDGDSQAHGIHSFEQFVRIEMRRKLEQTLGSSGGVLAGSGWPMDVKIIFLLWLGGAWNLDMISDPSATLYHVASMLVNCIFGLFIPMHLLTGLLSAIAAGANRAQKRWGWHPVAAYGAFATLTPFTMIVCTPFFAMVIPYSIEVGNTNWTLPDDGLDPDYDRRLLKMQIVTTALAAIAIVVQTWWK